MEPTFSSVWIACLDGICRPIRAQYTREVDMAKVDFLLATKDSSLYDIMNAACYRTMEDVWRKKGYEVFRRKITVRELQCALENIS